MTLGKGNVSEMVKFTDDPSLYNHVFICTLVFSSRTRRPGNSKFEMFELFHMSSGMTFVLHGPPEAKKSTLFDDPQRFSPKRYFDWFGSILVPERPLTAGAPVFSVLE